MTKQLIAATRRNNLAKWFSKRPIPAAEKSYLSQLIRGKAPFGEKAARRLENQYGMGDGYLDKDVDNAVTGGGTENSYSLSPQAIKLISVISRLDQAGGMEDVLTAAELLLRKSLPSNESALGPDALNGILGLDLYASKNESNGSQDQSDTKPEDVNKEGKNEFLGLVKKYESSDVSTDRRKSDRRKI